MEMINEDINLNNINNIYDAFSRHGIEYAEQHNQHAESVKLSSGNVESVGNSSDNSKISEEEFKKRIKDFFASFISNDTLKYIVELFNNYKGSNLDKKYAALINSYDSIKDAIDRDNQMRRSHYHCSLLHL